jgi:hypothetical protein
MSENQPLLDTDTPPKNRFIERALRLVDSIANEFFKDVAQMVILKYRSDKAVYCAVNTTGTEVEVLLRGQIDPKNFDGVQKWYQTIFFDRFLAKERRIPPLVGITSKKSFSSKGMTSHMVLMTNLAVNNRDFSD